MEWFALIGVVLALLSLYGMHRQRPELFSWIAMEKSMLVFGYLALFLIMVVTLAVVVLRS